MIRGGFLTPSERSELRALARDGRSEARAARRANAIILLDKGWSCGEVAEALLMDDDSVRSWHKLYAGHGIVGLVVFNYQGSQSHLTCAQEAALFEWVRQSLPGNTRMIGAWIAQTCGVDYSHAGLITLMHRLKISYRKPELVAGRIDAARQQAFIDGYRQLMNSLAANEAVVFADAVHPTHQVRLAGCWAPSQERIAIHPSSGRERLNIHGALDLETGRTRMIEAPTIDAHSTIQLLQSLEAGYAAMARIHVYLDNARYHHAKVVREWLSRPQCRIKLHFVPAYCPHLNPIERLWGLMHRHITHNKCYATCREFADATLGFLRQTVPRKWNQFCDSVTDNFRVINPELFRVLA